MLEHIKKNWIIVTIIGFCIAFSSKLYAVWNTPNQVQQTQKQVEELASNLNSYTSGQEEANKQRDKLIELLARKAMNQ